MEKLKKSNLNPNNMEKNKQIMMMRMADKFVPAQQDDDGKWVPIKDAKLIYGKDGIKVEKKTKKEKNNEAS